MGECHSIFKDSLRKCYSLTYFFFLFTILTPVFGFRSANLLKYQGARGCTENQTLSTWSRLQVWEITALWVSLMILEFSLTRCYHFVVILNIFLRKRSRISNSFAAKLPISLIRLGGHMINIQIMVSRGVKKQSIYFTNHSALNLCSRTEW